MTSAEADRASRLAAVMLALVLPGDTLLYLLLPIYVHAFDVSLAEAGILLAANRLVRIVGYGWIARAYASGGARRSCVAAAIGGSVACACYAVGSGLLPLLVARLIWGLSFAALNIANQALPTAVIEGAARRSGEARAVVALGVAVSLIVGAAIAYVANPRLVFALFALIGAIAPFVAARIVAPSEELKATLPRFERPGAISIWSFANGFTIDGLFIFGLGLLAAAAYPRDAVIATGCALAVRYLAEVFVSPLGGRLGSRYGVRRVLVLASFGTAASLVLLGVDGRLLWVGAVATVLVRAVALPLAAPLVAEAFPGPERVPALARQATWRDIGAGTGPLAAGLIFPVASPLVIYGAAALLIVATTLGLMRQRR